MTFDDFWAVWPDKQAKATARKAFQKLKPNERALAIERTAEWCKDWRARNPQASHIHAATFLNQRRFMDMDEAKQETQKVSDELIQMQAKWIKDGKDFLCRSIPSARIRLMVEAGLVTPDECRRVGL